MATEVLRPQDFWSDRFRLSPPAFRRRSYCPNTRPHRRPSLPRRERHDQRRKSPSPPPTPSTTPPPPQPQLQQRELISAPIPRRSLSADELQQAHHHNKFGAPTQMGGRVRILRREQSLDAIDATKMKRDVNNVATDLLIKENHMDEGVVYAGSAFFVSPSPSALPLPSFFNNNKTITTKNDQFHDSATRDLRRLLRLE